MDLETQRSHGHVRLSQASLPDVVKAWIAQLADPHFVKMIELNPERVDVKLSASRGKVRRRPEITLDGGVMEFTTPQ